MNEFCNKVFSGDVRASARLMRLVDDRAEGYEEYMKEVWKHTGRAHIIGITGTPGDNGYCSCNGRYGKRCGYYRNSRCRSR